MCTRFFRVACTLLLLSGAGCIDLSADSLLPVGTPFVVSGTAALVDSNGPCLVWLGENGITYHLFQDVRLPNETFDQITTPGVTSRLELAVRTDLQVACQVGSTAEVQDVLEIVE